MPENKKVQSMEKQAVQLIEAIENYDRLIQEIERKKLKERQGREIKEKIGGIK